jgi:cellulose synthase/poly-beta-1,6-N-acetylglucosamine synthase-like glycosyltransferase
MTALPLTLTGLVLLAALVWSSRHLMIWRERQTGLMLTDHSAGPPEKAPKISVLVAAKDEAACIETCVRTMLDQDYPNFEMIVCNDRSTDDTPEIVRRVAADDPRLRLVNITDLPQGWCGKNNAMQTGIATTAGEWICMIDADCRQLSRRTLSVAMQYASDSGADLLSVLPRLEMKTWWENVVQPVCSGVMMIWFRPDKVNDAKAHNAYANGAFILIRRGVYEAIGTHEAVKDRLNEDMHMARLVKEAGLRLRVIRGDDLYLVRMYTSFRQIIRGWSRIFYGTFGTLRRLVISLAVVTVMGLLPYLCAGLGLAGWAAGAHTAWAWRTLAISGLVAAAMQLSVIYRFYKLIRARPGLFWTYPIGCAVTIWALLLSLTKLGGAKVVWKSTGYNAAR